MSLSVQNRAERVGTFRYTHVFLMETIARWVPNTPEMEVKVIFGRHIWDLARQADALGKRTYELRAPLQFSLRPLQPYVDFLEEFARAGSTQQKLQGFYDVVLPGLEARYQSYLAQTDRLLDEPTVRVIDGILGDFARMRKECDALQTELPNLRSSDKEWALRLSSIESAHANIIAHKTVTAVAS